MVAIFYFLLFLAIYLHYWVVLWRPRFATSPLLQINLFILDMTGGTPHFNLVQQKKRSPEINSSRKHLRGFSWELPTK